MRVLRIEIRNYRCFLNFELDLGGESLLLVASNAGGKTSLLRAVRMALQGRGMPLVGDLPSREAPLEVILTVADIPASAHGVFANALSFTQPPQLRIGVRATWNEAEQELDVEHGFPDDGWRRVGREAREQLPVLWLPAWRDVSRLVSFTGPTSFLDQLVQTLDIDGPLDTALTEVTAAGNYLSQAPALQSMLGALGDELRGIVPAVPTDAFALGVTAGDARELLRQFDLLVAYEGPPLPASRHSGGITQLAIFVIALRLLSATPGAVVLIDEPEQALHPHAQRALLAAFRERGRQMMVATHAPSVLDRVDPHTVTRLRRTMAGDTEAIRPAPLPIAEARRLARHATAQTAESFFASAVVVFEGISDLLAFRVFSDRLGVALDARGATLLSLDGADLFGTYLALLGPNGLDMRIVGICDADRETRWTTALNSVGITVGDRATLSAAGFEVCDPDLEAELLLPLTTSEVQQVIDADGASTAFSTFAQQPAHSRLPLVDQQARFIRRDKVRWAPLLASAVDLQNVPTPISQTIGRL